MPEQLMLDPSLFVSRRGIGAIESAWRLGELENVALPASFAFALREGSISERALRFFGARADLPDLLPMSKSLASEMRLREYEPKPENLKGLLLHERLGAIAKDTLVFEVLAQEWQFLNSESWIASRIKKPFSAFVRAGGVAIEWGRRAFDRSAAKVLKIPPREMPRALASRQRLRAVSKWIAVGGPVVLSLVEPISAAVGSAVAGYFLLFDP